MAIRNGVEKAGRVVGVMQTGGKQQTSYFRRTFRPVCQGWSANETLSPGNEWTMRVDLGRQLQFPREIMETLLRSDLVMWSEACKTVLVELTVPWEWGTTAVERSMLLRRHQWTS